MNRSNVCSGNAWGVGGQGPTLTRLLQALLDAMAEGPWETLARRRVQHFGHRFEYEVRRQWPTSSSSG